MKFAGEKKWYHREKGSIIISALNRIKNNNNDDIKTKRLFCFHFDLYFFFGVKSFGFNFVLMMPECCG
jgi:hypothetical protein